MRTLPALHQDSKTFPSGPFLFLQYLLVSVERAILTIYRTTTLQSEMITARIWNKIYHLTLTALPHYRVKYEKLQFGKKARIFLIMRKAVNIL